MKCDTCVHDGQCDGLPYCNGASYQSVFAECDQCGKTINTEIDETYDDDEDHIFCSLECMEEFEGGAV